MPNLSKVDINTLPIMEQICHFLRYVLTDEIKNVLGYDDINVYYTDYNSEVIPYIPIQLFYDEPNQRVYIYYDLQNAFDKQKYDLIEYYLRINSRIINMFHDWFKPIYPEILAPANIYNDKRISQKIGTSDTTLGINTFTYWMIDETSKYQFINNDYYFERDAREYLDNGGTQEKLREYMDRAVEIQSLYDLRNQNTDIPEMFEQFSELYKEYFNKELVPIDMNDADHFSSLYLNLIYSLEEETK